MPIPARPEERDDGNRKNASRRFEISHDADVSADTLPDARTLFFLGVQYGDVMKSGKAEDFPANLSEEQIRWIKLLVSGKVSVKQVQGVNLETLVPIPAPQPVREKLSESIALRWPDLVVTTLPSNAVDLPRRWSSIGGKLTSVRASMDSRSKPSREWMTDVRDVPHKLNSYQELALWRIFAIGVGFASRIHAIESERIEDDQLVVSATLEIWPGSSAPAILHIDKYGIVRQAKIDTGITTITVTTTGLRHYSEDFQGATQGKFSRAYKRNPETTAPAFEMETQSIDFDISNERFNELADLSPPPGERISDVTPAAHKKLEPIPEPQAGDDSNLAVTLFLVGAALISIWLMMRLRKKWRN